MAEVGTFIGRSERYRSEPSCLADIACKEIA